MVYLSYFIAGLYGLALLVIFFYSLSQLALLINYIKIRKEEKGTTLSAPTSWPLVTIQLPVYNEKYVMERLLTCITSLDYDRDKLEIQVLDDSTDETVEQTNGLVKILQATGVDIKIVRRENRDSYKAGALKYALEKAKGDFIAIFDADFLPPTDWLKKTLEGFTSDNIGVVQTRWGHVNATYSLLTRVQAFALDAHFTLEQKGRNAGGHFINFNGTAGIWRKACIIDAGNWSGNTLTEDLDLSYRAQLKGWKFKFLENVVAPAELPVAISAAKSQQFRWNKGGAENLIQMLPKVLRSKTTPFKTKLHAIFHLGNSSMFFFVLAVSILSVPMLFIKHRYPALNTFYRVNTFFVLSTLILFICHWVVYKNLHGSRPKNFVFFIGRFISFFTLALGFSLHNSLAVSEAFRGKKSAFIRTPKFAVVKSGDGWKSNQYLTAAISPAIIAEIFLFLYFIFGFCSSLYLKDYSMIPFHLMLSLGFGYVVYTSLKNNQ